MYYRLSDEEKALGILQRPKGIEYGIGLAIALFVMQGTKSILCPDSFPIFFIPQSPQVWYGSLSSVS